MCQVGGQQWWVGCWQHEGCRSFLPCACIPSLAVVLPPVLPLKHCLHFAVISKEQGFKRGTAEGSSLQSQHANPVLYNSNISQEFSFKTFSPKHSHSKIPWRFICKAQIIRGMPIHMSKDKQVKVGGMDISLQVLCPGCPPHGYTFPWVSAGHPQP